MEIVSLVPRIQSPTLVSCCCRWTTTDGQTDMVHHRWVPEFLYKSKHNSAMTRTIRGPSGEYWYFFYTITRNSESVTARQLRSLDRLRSTMSQLTSACAVLFDSPSCKPLAGECCNPSRISGWGCKLFCLRARTGSFRRQQAFASGFLRVFCFILFWTEMTNVSTVSLNNSYSIERKKGV